MVFLELFVLKVVKWFLLYVVDGCFFILRRRGRVVLFFVDMNDFVKVSNGVVCEYVLVVVFFNYICLFIYGKWCNFEVFV